jgi:class 3 adenylate cyclase
LSKATKEFQARLLVSESVRRSLGGITAVEDLGLVEIRGQPQPARVFKVA